MVRERNSKRRLAAQQDESLPPTLQIPCGEDDKCPLLRPGIEMLKTLGRTTFGGDGRPVCPCAHSCFFCSGVAAQRQAAHSAAATHTALEIGAGLGRFILAKARKNPDRHYIGLEIERVRSARIDVKARKEGLRNISLVCADAAWFLEFCVPPGSLDEIYILFPDPWPRAKHEKNRIFQPDVIALIHRALRRGGVLHAATDHAAYFERMREVMADEVAAGRFAEVAAPVRDEDELTDFELKFLAKGMTVNSAAWEKM